MALRFIKQKRIVRRSLASLAMVTVLFGILNAQENLTDKLPVDPRVKIGKLSNGLTYYIQKNVRPEKKVELRLVVNAGSILEDDDQQGLGSFYGTYGLQWNKEF